jgi:purine-binding chemotaxis protein CheW
MLIVVPFSGNRAAQATGRGEAVFMAQESSSTYALFYINGALHGIDSAYVLSFVHLNEVFSLPDKPEYCRGLIKYSDGLIPAVDLRVFLKMKSAESDAQELSEMMKQRKADHLHWMDALYQAATANTEFKLAADHHKCAFGEWFDAYRTDDIGMKQYLRRFKRPHEQIHRIAQVVLEKRDNNDLDGALSIIEQTRNNELSEMVALFDEFDEAYKASRREIVIVVSDGASTVGVIVDAILALEHLNAAGTDNLGSDYFENSEGVAVGTREPSGEVVVIFDVMRLLSSH